MKQGYTLVELLISIAILSLLLGAGTLSFRDFTRRQQVIGAVRQVKGDLRLAQTEALSGKKPTGCSGNLNGYRFSRVSATSYRIEADCSGPGSPILVRNVNMPPTTNIDAFSPNPPGGVVLFRSVAQGTNLSGDVTITVRAISGTTYSGQIVINRGGDVR